MSSQAQASLQTSAPGQRHLRLLSIDGGGVKGLAALFCIQKVMEQVPRDADGKSPKPCDHFDMMVGTSTGGLIAIMLGRLSMSVEDCIDEYVALMDPLFPHTTTQWFSNKLLFNWKANVRSRYNHETLEDHVKQLVKKKLGDENALMKDTRPSSCKVAVVAMSGCTSETVTFASYLDPQSSDTELYNCTKIWEAARATSAATGFFQEIEIGRFKQKFYDGGTGANNPVSTLWEQAQRQFTVSDLEANVQCLLSVGTGLPSLREWTSGVGDVVQGLKSMATETRRTADKFQNTHEDLRKAKRYVRLDAEGVGDLDLAAAEKKDVIADRTKAYLGRSNVWENVVAIARYLEEVDFNLADEHQPYSTLPMPHKQLPFVADDARRLIMQSIMQAFETAHKDVITTISLWGLRGTGKSRLAWEIAANLQRMFGIEKARKAQERPQQPPSPNDTQAYSATHACSNDVCSRQHQPAPAKESEWLSFFRFLAMLLPVITLDFDLDQYDTNYNDEAECSDPVPTHVPPEPVSKTGRDSSAGRQLDEVQLQYPRLCELSKNLHVFWVSAASKDTFLRSYEDIGRQVGLEKTAPPEPGGTVLEVVQIWLQNPRNGPWLLVLDDADAETLQESDLSKYLPATSKKVSGFLVFTSVTDTVGNLFHADVGHGLQGLDEHSACTLFRAGESGPPATHVAELVNELGMVPSAIISASAYIKESGGLETVESYMERYKTNVEARLRRLNFDHGGLSLERGFSRSPIKSWQMTFAKIEQQATDAMSLLRVLLCLSGERITPDFLGQKLDNDLLMPLAKYGILSRLRGPGSQRVDQQTDPFFIPRHIQLIGQAWLLHEGQFHTAHMSALDMLGTHLTALDTKYSKEAYTKALRKQRELLSHIDVFLSYCRASNLEEPWGNTGILTGDRATKIATIACLYSVDGQFQEARDLLLPTYRYYKVKDLHRVDCLVETAACLRNEPVPPSNGKKRALKKATDMLKEAREICSAIFVADPDIGDVLSNESQRAKIQSIRVLDELAMLLCERMMVEENRVTDLYTRALATQEEALQWKRECFGEESVEFYDSKLQRSRINFKLGRILRGANNTSPHLQTLAMSRQAKLEKAEQDQRDVLKSLAQEQIACGADTPLRVCSAQVALARTLYELDRSSEAVGFFELAHRERCRLLGTEALMTLKTAQDRAMCMSAAKHNVEDAQQLWSETLTALKRKLGANDYLARCARERWDARDTWHRILESAV